jgi:hypothetical protein
MGKSWQASLALLIVGAVLPTRGDDGIAVGRPKVYDDHYLQSQLNNLRSKLATLVNYDATALGGRVGTQQGGQLSQSTFSLGAAGPGSPGVQTEVTSATKTTTTQAAVNPSVPTGTLGGTLPTTFGLSALDTLSEMTQLNYQIINYQLLLEGAISDQFQLRGGGKKKLTMGFPITIESLDRKEEGEIAEVEITVCNNAMAAASAEESSVTTILPLENTYNTVSITDKSQSVGVGALIGTFNVGAFLGMGRKTYYVVKQQDVRALLREPRWDVACGLRELLPEEVASVTPDSVINAASDDSADATPVENVVFKIGGKYKKRLPRLTFAWQFLPTLGQPAVKPGIRNVFVQLAVPKPDVAKSLCSGHVYARTSWIPAQKERYLFSPPPPPMTYPKAIGEIFEYDTAPYTFDLQVRDLGNGNILAQAKGAFLEGLKVRIGTTVLDATSPGFVSSRDSIQFVAPAQAIVLGDVFLVGSDGVAHELRYWPDRVTPPYRSLSCIPTEDRSQKEVNSACPHKHKDFTPDGIPRIVQVNRDAVTVEPLSDTFSRVKIRVDSVESCAREELTKRGKYRKADEDAFPLVASVGGKMYGLLDSPFEKPLGMSKGRSSDEMEIWIAASNDSLRSSPSVRVQRLLMGPAYSSGDWIPITPPHEIRATLVSAGDPAIISLSGLGAGALCLLQPVPDAELLPCGKETATKAGEPSRKVARASVQVVSEKFALVKLSKDAAAGAKQMVFALTPLGSSGSSTQVVAVAVPAEAKPPAPSKAPDLKEADVVPGAAKLTTAGANFDQIAGIKYLEQWLTFVIAPEGKSITVDLPSSSTSGEGIRYLDIVALDRSTTRHKLTVAAKKP